MKPGEVCKKKIVKVNIKNKEKGRKIYRNEFIEISKKRLGDFGRLKYNMRKVCCSKQL